MQMLTLDALEKSAPDGMATRFTDGFVHTIMKQRN